MDLQGEHLQGDDQGQGHGNDHGRVQEPNAFWSDGVQDELRLEHARPAGLPSETPSDNLLELDLDEDELRTAGESTPPSSWEPLANHGGSQGDAVGPQSVHVSIQEFRRWASQGIPCCSHC
eukprot:s379_g44.t1